ncbi:MAG: DUF4230 domain-containing protein [Verrucomicrobiae bacterium]|nr:DUF4230 domain-containing protein [Verrucomicrobiae bacterium]
MPESPSSEAANPAPKGEWFAGSRLVWIVAILALAGVAVFLGVLWSGKRGLDTLDKGISAAGEVASRIAEAFRPEAISQTFVTYTELKVAGTEGNILEVATAEATESFTRTTNVVWFDRVVPFGTTVSEISVPATYRYHIDLNGEWNLAAYDDRIIVVAPPIQPTLPVAFDTGKMQKKTQSGWARWDGDENLRELETSLTAKLEERAKSPETLDRIREDSRLAVAKFVKNWLVSREHWGNGTYREIVVVFPDEVGKPNSPSLTSRPATLRWEASADGLEPQVAP